ncbi:hypothetical protein Q3F51_12495, partial [Enterococcus faecium]|uniref:hypothetical protein n=3 Tax=Enterococcus faecium TaxID=1352 RepID=UPI00280CC51C|nr:hypothetical protein [Enterococcus faecium]
IIGNPSLNHRYRKGFYSLFKTLQQNRFYDGLQQVLNAFGVGQFANVQVLESVRFMEDHEALVYYLIDEIGKEQMVG